VRVLVIDDSAVVRQTLRRLLMERGGMQVTVAADPLFALTKLRQARPDVIVLDLHLPRMDGLSFLSLLMAENPIPVVICSAITTELDNAALAALSRGAVEIITKPKLGVRDFLHDSAVLIVDAVRAAAAARPALGAQRARQAPEPAVVSVPRIKSAPMRVCAIGASTGGVDAMMRVLPRIPADGPGIVMVQHMPEGFTAAFARRLDQLCAIHVREAAQGDRVDSGVALLAPGNRHMLLKRDGPYYAVRLEDGPLVSCHRPSVDVLFGSVAAVAGADAVGVIMTGMGADGAEGLLAMRQAGAITLAQDEESCVVFGMPKEAIARGAVQHTVPLNGLAVALLGAAYRAG
jgi:two-component system chemotaxis response regulator CheB